MLDLHPEQLAWVDACVDSRQPAQLVRVILLPLPKDHILALQPEVPLPLELGVPGQRVKHRLQMRAPEEEERSVLQHLPIVNGVEQRFHELPVFLSRQPVNVQLRRHVDEQVAKLDLVDRLCKARLPVE